MMIIEKIDSKLPPEPAAPKHIDAVQELLDSRTDLHYMIRDDLERRIETLKKMHANNLVHWSKLKDQMTETFFVAETLTAHQQHALTGTQWDVDAAEPTQRTYPKGTTTIMSLILLVMSIGMLLGGICDGNDAMAFAGLGGHFLAFIGFASESDWVKAAYHNARIKRANVDNVKTYDLDGPNVAPLKSRFRYTPNYMERLYKGLEANDPQFTVPFVKFYDSMEELREVVRMNYESSLSDELKELHITQADEKMEEILADMDNTLCELVNRENEERRVVEALEKQTEEDQMLMEQAAIEVAQISDNQRVIYHTAQVLSKQR